MQVLSIIDQPYSLGRRLCQEIETLTGQGYEVVSVSHPVLITSLEILVLIGYR
jgi:hypothetical protein